MSDSSIWGISSRGAEIYAEFFVPGMVEEWVPRVVALAKPGRQDRVLDVACGNGALTEYVARSLGPGGRIVGLDTNVDMLEVARSTALADAAPIQWCEGNAQGLPYPDEAFDVVYCELGLQFFPDRPKALAEMRRVLAPGGRLALMVWGDIAKSPAQAAMATVWEQLFGAEAAVFFQRQHALSDPQQTRTLLTDAGFRDVDVQAEMGTMRFPSAEHLVRAYGALTRRQTDAMTCDRAIGDVTRLLQAHTGTDGLVCPVEAILARATK
jgi:ubiquinone/menaquinone biosynthesis C-methylase UbiE